MKREEEGEDTVPKIADTYNSRKSEKVKHENNNSSNIGERCERKR